MTLWPSKVKRKVPKAELDLANRVNEKHLMSDRWLADVIRGLEESPDTAKRVMKWLNLAMKD
jgi:hypothetical protein